MENHVSALYKLITILTTATNFFLWSIFRTFSERTTTAQIVATMASTMQVRYKLRDYYKEASEKYRLEVNSRGQYLSVPGCDENSPTRYASIILTMDMGTRTC